MKSHNTSPRRDFIQHKLVEREGERGREREREGERERDLHRKWKRETRV